MHNYQYPLALLCAFALCLMIVVLLKMAAKAVGRLKKPKPQSIDDRISQLVADLKKNDARKMIAERKLMIAKLKGVPDHA